LKFSNFLSFLQVIGALLAISILMVLTGVSIRLYLWLERIEQKTEMNDAAISNLLSSCNTNATKEETDSQAKQSAQTAVINRPVMEKPKRPADLKSAYLLPMPPENRGRVIAYESYKILKQDDDNSMVEFKEWEGNRSEITIYPLDAIRWEVLP